MVNDCAYDRNLAFFNERLKGTAALGLLFSIIKTFIW